MDRGWSLKAPAPADRRRRPTYRQSSRVTPELLAQGPLQPPARARAAVPGRRRDRPRHRAGGQRPARPEGRRRRASSRPRPTFLFQPPASYGPKVWDEATGAGPLPPGALHVPLPLGAVSRAPDLRRPQRRLLLRPPRPVEHAAPGPDHAQRADLPRVRPGPGAAGARAKGAATDAERLALRLPPLPGRGRRPQESRRRCSACCTGETKRFAYRAADPWDLAADEPDEAAAAARRRHPGPARRWTAVAACLAEPRRDDHQGMKPPARSPHR